MNLLALQSALNHLQNLTQFFEYPQCSNMKGSGITKNESNWHYESTCCGDNSGRWGNALAPLWQARAMALLGGYSYSYHTAHNDKSWISYLPKTFEPIASRIDHAQFEIACNNCNNAVCADWQYPAACHGAIDFIQDIIVNETRTALTKWFKDNERVIPEFGENDWYIYDRCASDTVLDHGAFGLTRFQTMRAIDQSVENIYIVADAEQQKKIPLCTTIMKSRTEYLKKHYPSINIEFVGKDIANDFMTLVFAKNVIVTFQGSTFAMMATLANNGNIYRPKHRGNIARNVIPNGTRSNKKIHYFTNELGEPLLPNNKYGIKKSETQRILDWLNEPIVNVSARSDYFDNA